ncbi:hypothetical protein [Trebonia kvetii]|uniref:hypothetical protein n=1 Tax=Trebonia kvetii TaxID=2480626 RepID=UPI001FE3629E|nr:hypothetical protein [Trebonia kvetii]
MSAPVTTFNEQYSDPAATATGWEETRKALEVAELFWLSTVRADGPSARHTRRRRLGRGSHLVFHRRQ